MWEMQIKPLDDASTRDIEREKRKGKRRRESFSLAFRRRETRANGTGEAKGEDPPRCPTEGGTVFSRAKIQERFREEICSPRGNRIVP